MTLGYIFHWGIKINVDKTTIHWFSKEEEKDKTVHTNALRGGCSRLKWNGCYLGAAFLFNFLNLSLLLILMIQFILQNASGVLIVTFTTEPEWFSKHTEACFVPSVVVLPWSCIVLYCIPSWYLLFITFSDVDFHVFSRPKILFPVVLFLFWLPSFQLITSR